MSLGNDPTEHAEFAAPLTRRSLTRRALLAGTVGGIGALLPPGRASAAARDSPVPASSVLVADQSGRRLLVVDLRSPSAEAPDIALPGLVRERWRWMPEDYPELDGLEPRRTWIDVSEAKPRAWQGRQVLLGCASEGLVVVVDYPSGAVLWATAVPGPNEHSMEVLPGSVAVAASDPGWVRVYPAALGSVAMPDLDGAFTEFELPGAHGVCWDPARSVLWALGTGDLVALAVKLTSGGTPAVQQVRRVLLPKDGGHDLDHAVRNPGQFWLSTGSSVLRFDPSTGSFLAVPDIPSDEQGGVKSVGDQPGTGRLLTVRPDGSTPVSWRTSTLSLHTPEERVVLHGTGFYKARWLAFGPGAGA